jgi:hypothetical protein
MFSTIGDVDFRSKYPRRDVRSAIAAVLSEAATTKRLARPAGRVLIYNSALIATDGNPASMQLLRARAEKNTQLVDAVWKALRRLHLVQRGWIWRSLRRLLKRNEYVL